MPSFSDWPESPLDAAQRAFDLLICPPAPLAFDGRGFDGCPVETALVWPQGLGKVVSRTVIPPA